jgi:hypothetical protein
LLESAGYGAGPHAAPPPLRLQPRGADDLGPHGAQDDAPADLRQAALFLEKRRLEAFLETLAASPIPPVEALRRLPMDSPQAERQVGVQGFEAPTNVVGLKSGVKMESIAGGAGLPPIQEGPGHGHPGNSPGGPSLET